MEKGIPWKWNEKKAGLAVLTSLKTQNKLENNHFKKRQKKRKKKDITWYRDQSNKKI